MLATTICGPNGGQLNTDLTSYANWAMHFFAEQLGIDKLRMHIELRLHSKACFHNAEGLTTAFNRRDYRLDVCLFTNWVMTLAHEMVHVKQFARNELDYNLTLWKGQSHIDTPYYDSPWEIEAYELQGQLVLNFEQHQMTLLKKHVTQQETLH